MNRINPNTEEDLSNARQMFKWLKPHLIEVSTQILEEQRSQLWDWVKDNKNVRNLFITDVEYNILDSRQTDPNNPTMDDILASIRRIISEEPYTTIRLYFVDKSDAIKFKLVWYKNAV